MPASARSASEVFLAGIKLLQDIEHAYQGCYQTLRDEVKIGIEASDHGDGVNAATVLRIICDLRREDVNQ